jgi:hypothetical protein
MPDNEIKDTITYHGRKFLITKKDSCEEGVEFIQLLEAVTASDGPLEHFIKSDGFLSKTVPIILASRSAKEPEIQVSMHYEGLPLALVRRFLEFVEKTWK